MAPWLISVPFMQGQKIAVAMQSFFNNISFQWNRNIINHISVSRPTPTHYRRKLSEMDSMRFLRLMTAWLVSCPFMQGLKIAVAMQSLFIKIAFQWDRNIINHKTLLLSVYADEARVMPPSLTLVLLVCYITMYCGVTLSQLFSRMYSSSPSNLIAHHL